MSLATVAYQIGTYSGRIEVNCGPDDDQDDVIASAKAALKRKCGGTGIYPGGPCHESWRILSFEDEGEDS
jgi:hypothetical protein